MKFNRHHAVGVSAESAAAAWARQEGAPGGAVLRMDHEIAGRLRGGVPARPGPALAVVLRPMLAIDDEDRLWAAALVATMRLLDISNLLAGWPDVVGTGDSSSAFVTVTTQTAMGRIEMAIVTCRTSGLIQLPGAESFANEMLAASQQAVDDFDHVAQSYAAFSGLIGQRVVAALLPRGETRGTVTGLAADGRLRLESTTGMTELLAAAAVRSVKVVADR